MKINFEEKHGKDHNFMANIYWMTLMIKLKLNTVITPYCLFYIVCHVSVSFYWRFKFKSYFYVYNLFTLSLILKIPFLK